MNSQTIIDIPPRIIRPSSSKRSSTRPTPPSSDIQHLFDGDDDLRNLAQQIVKHDPALALLLARAGQRVRNS